MSTAISPSLRTPRPKPQTDYSQLLKTIQQAGLMKRRYGYYAVKCSLMMLAVLAIGTGIVVLGDSWWQLVLAALLGLVFAQFGFLGHDAAHRQIFVSGKANHRAGLVLGTLFSGMSLVWWNSKHNKHHQAPNQISKDPDIAPMVLHFYPVEPKPDRRPKLVMTDWACRFTPSRVSSGKNNQPCRVRKNAANRLRSGLGSTG